MEEVSHHYLILIRKKFLVILDPVRIERLQNSFSIILPITRMHSGAVNATLL